ncbi:MAG: Lrp/AsnC family transcriptional regulator [Hyphomonadaceae bacterium]|nr:Lrp/AsnC family transcriptional regulator [Hyphomonadaceae bacterium]
MKQYVELDTIDRKILGIIQDDCTRPIKEIAEAVGLSNNPCWRRIKRLEDNGVIRKRVALVDPAKIGLGVTAFVTIRTDQHTSDWLAAFRRAVRNIPEIIACHRMTGDVDYLLRVVVHDIEHYDNVYQRLIKSVPHLSDVSSTFSMERMKQGPAIDVARIL